MGRVSAILGNGHEIKGQSYVARLQRSVLRVCYRSLCLVFDVLGESYLDTCKWPYGQQSRLPFRRSAIVSQDGRFITFDFVNPLSKGNGVRGKMPNVVFWRAGGVLFVSEWMAMLWSKVLFRAS